MRRVLAIGVATAALAGGAVVPVQATTCALRQVSASTTIGGEKVDLFIFSDRCGGTVRNIRASLTTGGKAPIWQRSLELWRLAGPAKAPIVVRSAALRSDGVASTAHVIQATGRSIPYRPGFSGVLRLTLVVNGSAVPWAVFF